MSSLQVKCASCGRQLVFPSAQRSFLERMLRDAVAVGWRMVSGKQMVCSDECASRLARNITPMGPLKPAR